MGIITPSSTDEKKYTYQVATAEIILPPEYRIFPHMTEQNFLALQLRE